MKLKFLVVSVCSFAPFSFPFSVATAGDASNETSARTLGAPEEVGTTPTGAGAREAA